jgi:proteasome assembly chaperone (PAC2) family protein
MRASAPETGPVNTIRYRARPELVDPVAICAFGGWNDGGEGATSAARDLRDQWGARRFASLDPEEFYDFQVHRPTVRLVDGETRRIDWPANEFWWARTGVRDVIVFVGLEPNLRWRTYCESILRVCRDAGASLIVTMGAFLADVPHTVPAPVTAASTDPAWATRAGMVPTRYEGPTGIVGVLNDLATRSGVASVSLWGASPHYLPQNANPKVALALMERLRDLVGLPVDTGDVEAAAGAWEREVTEAIEEDGNLQQYVRRLEEAVGEGGFSAEASDVSGEDLAAELERYLRERGSTDLD